MTHVEKAEALFSEGFNCAQAVYGAFAQELGMEEETAMRVASSLGGGLATGEEACGAALGMALAIGMAQGYVTPDKEAKAAHSARVKRTMQAFRDRFGDTRCNALREVGNRAVCVPYIHYAVTLVEQEIDRSEG